MGLDSVELLLQFERKFEIQISDEEAVKLSSLSDMTNCISQHKNVSKRESDTIANEKEKILALLIQLFPILTADSKIDNYINSSNSKEILDLIGKKTNLMLPKPDFDFIEKKSLMSKILFWKPNYNWKDLTVQDFIDGILIKNYLKFVDFRNPESLQEIYFGVAGITSTHMDVNPYEITPEKTFTKDLGID